jgi:hypothetical protein
VALRREPVGQRRSKKTRCSSDQEFHYVSPVLFRFQIIAPSLWALSKNLVKIS